MKRILILVLVITNATIANASTLRVGFTATNPVAGVDFATLQAAHDAAIVGDTIQIYPAIPSVVYSCTMTKRLNLFGTGYFTDGGYNANTGLQNIGGSCDVRVTLDSGANGSLFQGLGTSTINGNTSFTAVNLDLRIVKFAKVNNITVKRCNVNANFANYAPNDSWTFTQCFIVGGFSFYYYDGTTATNGGRGVTNLRVENCIFKGYIDFTASPTNGVNGQFVNNVFLYNYSAFHGGSFLVQNNIYPLGNSSDNASNCIFKNNITNSPLSGNDMNTVTSSGNKFNVNFSPTDSNIVSKNPVFYGYPHNVDKFGNYIYSEDARYQVKAGSVASGAGVGGVDCGPFGGTAPYKLAGIPATPSFYKLTAPSNTATSSPYIITFSVRSNN